MPRNRVRQIALNLAPTLVVIGIFALGFLGRPEDSAWLNSSPLWRKGDPFFFLGRNALASPLLIWRGRPGQRGAAYRHHGATNDYDYNALGLRDDEIETPKPAGVLRVLSLGDSATWGLNLADRSESYPDQLQTILNGPSAPRRYDVINGGTLGYSSLQALQFLRYYVDELEPDVVTLLIGNNDTTVAGVEDKQRISGQSSALQRVLSRNFFFLLLQKGWLALKASALDESQDRFIQQTREKSQGDALALARVSPEDHEANLRAFVELARERRIRVILLKVPMNLVWPQRNPEGANEALDPESYWSPVFIAPDYLGRAWAGRPPCASPLPGHAYLCLVSPPMLATESRPDPDAVVAQLRARATRRGAATCGSERERHNLAVALLVVGHLEESIRILDELVAEAGSSGPCVSSRDLAAIHQSLGIAQLLRGEGQAALAALTEARRVWPFALTPRYVERFDHVVRDLDVEWIDLPALFAEADPDFFGSGLIHDWVHPDARGNRIIAEALARRLVGP